MRIDLVKRRDATNKTAIKYRLKPFSWKEARTCLHMLRTHMRNMGRKPPPIPAFQSPVGARRALKDAGFVSLEELIDSLLEPIPPAAMIIGDVAVLRGGEGFGAIVISAGGGKVLGYSDEHLDQGLMNIIPLKIEAAWRV